MSHFFSDIAFTPAAKDIQSRRGTRKIYEKVEARGGFRTEITEDLVAFLGSVDTAYLATASAGVYLSIRKNVGFDTGEVMLIQRANCLK